MSYDSLLGGAAGMATTIKYNEVKKVCELISPNGSVKLNGTFMQKIKLFWCNNKALVIGGGVALLLVILVLAWGGGSGGGKGKKGKKSKKGGKKGKKSKKGKKKKSGFLPFQNQSASILG